MQPLDNVLEKAYVLTWKRKKSVLRTKKNKNIPLPRRSWSTEHKPVLALIQDKLRSAVKMTFPNLEKVMCAYTDASEARWEAIVAQTKEKLLETSTEQQQHEPLALLAGKLNGSQRNWTTYKINEDYAVVQAFDRLDRLFWRMSQAHMFMDHSNLSNVFAPLALRQN